MSKLTEAPEGQDGAAAKPHEPKVVIFIDKEQFKLDVEEVTVAKLFELAGEDPKETVMALKHGNELIKYTDLNQKIHLKNGMKFVVIHCEPTPVS